MFLNRLIIDIFFFPRASPSLLNLVVYQWRSTYVEFNIYGTRNLFDGSCLLFYFGYYFCLVRTCVLLSITFVMFGLNTFESTSVFLKYLHIKFTFVQDHPIFSCLYRPLRRVAVLFVLIIVGGWSRRAEVHFANSHSKALCFLNIYEFPWRWKSLCLIFATLSRQLKSSSWNCGLLAYMTLSRCPTYVATQQTNKWLSTYFFVSHCTYDAVLNLVSRSTMFNIGSLTILKMFIPMIRSKTSSWCGMAA